MLSNTEIFSSIRTKAQRRVRTVEDGERVALRPNVYENGTKKKICAATTAFCIQHSVEEKNGGLVRLLPPRRRRSMSADARRGQHTHLYEGQIPKSPNISIFPFKKFKENR